MIKIYSNLSTTLFLVFCCSCFCHSQEDKSFDLIYEINKTYPPFSIEEEKLNEIKTLIDVNPKFELSWIRDYIQVEISTIQNGKIIKTVSENDTLSKEQKHHIKSADLDEDISVLVQYIPENILKHNDVKELNFTFKITPSNDASYPGGDQLMNRYINENIITKTAINDFKKHQLTLVTFSINEKGQINDAEILSSSVDSKVEKTLLEAICNMPNWIPAQHSNGVKTKQNFVLMVGDRYSCTINLINIDRN